MPSLWRTSRLRRSPASWRSPSLIMSSTPFTEVGCMGLRLTFLLILCSCVQMITGLTWHHQKGKTLQMWPHTFPSSSFKYSCPASVTLTSAPIGTTEPESNHTKSPFIETASGVRYKDGLLGGWWSETIILTLTKCNILETWIRSAGMKDHSWCQSVVLITGTKTFQVIQTEIGPLMLRVNIRDLTESSVVSHLRFLNPSAQQLPSDRFPGCLWSRKFQSKRLFMTLWLCSCWRATPSHKAIRV